MQIRGDERLLQPALVEGFENRALAREACIGHGQAAGDLARRRRHEFIPQAMAALRAVRPQLVEYGNALVATRRPCVIGTDGLDGRLKTRKLDPSLR